MAVVLDATSVSDTTGAAATSFTDSTNMTVGTGSNRAIFVMIQWSSTQPTAISITWDGVALSLVSGSNHANGTGGNTAIYALANPNSGTLTLAGSWTGSRSFNVAAVSFTGVDQTTPAINGNFFTGSANPISFASNQTLGNYIVVAIGSSANILSITSGTQVFIDNTQVPGAAGVIGAATGASQQFTATVSGTATYVAALAVAQASTAAAVVNPLPFWPDSTSRVRSVVNFTPWVFLGPVSAATGPAVSGGTFTDAGTTFRRAIQYQSIVQPVNFTPPAVVNNGWYVSWPDFARRPRPLPDLTPWTFIPPPKQVFFPYGPWDDFARRKPQPLDTQPLIWGYFTPAQVVTGIVASDQSSPGPVFSRRIIYRVKTEPVFVPPPVFAFNSYVNWPDFASKAKPAADFIPWTFLEPAPQVWFPPNVSPDIVPTRARPTVDFIPWSFVAPTQTTPWAVWTPWPDIAPRRAVPTADFRPWSFVEPPPQIWYPPEKWPDSAPAARRVAHQPDWSYGTFVTPIFVPTWTQWTQWPDFALRKKPAADFVPWAFLEPAPQVWYPPNVFPDIVPIRAKPVADFIPWSFVAPTLTTPWTQWSPWPDVVPYRAKPAADFIPWTFVPPPAQVWFPPPQWADFVFRKFAQRDTQPLAFLTVVTTIPLIQSGLYQWPDFAKGKAVPLNYDPLTFTQTVRTPVNGFIQWPDFVRSKAVPLNYDPLTLVQTVRTPWNTMTMWPDFAPIRGKAGLHAALQQFYARFPGTITGTTINAIMNAFETNADNATFAIYVVQSQPAVKAAVSIKEIGILGGSVTP